MNVGILMITHSDIGKQMLLTATSVFGKNPFRVEILSVDNYDQPNDVRVVAGLNLSMLLNVFNYSTDSLNQLANRAVDGGITGIMKL